MTPQVILYSGWYSPGLCRDCANLLFIFGDNLLGFGKGGQAIIRGQPNAFGIPTKRKPAMTEESFFHEKSESDLDAVLAKIGECWHFLEEGRTIVVPVTTEGEISLGLERARLREKAPSIYHTIANHVEEMCTAFGRIEIEDRETLLSYSRAVL